MYAYDETRNLIEVRDRGVKIITLLLDHNLSYAHNTYYEKPLNIKFCFSNLRWQGCPFIMHPFLQIQLWEPLVLVQLALESHTWLLSSHCEHNRFAKGNWIEKKNLNQFVG